jgi:tellurite resistance protein
MADRYIISKTITPELTTNDPNQWDQEVMQALVTTGALVALSDGRVETVERDELVRFVDQQGFAPTIAPEEIAETFAHRVRQLEDRHSASVIVESLRPLAGRSLASVVVRTAERVAAADRKIHPAELHAIQLIRLVMTNLPASRPTTRDGFNKRR